MLYEFRIAADSEQEVHDALLAVAAALLHRPLPSNVLHIARFREQPFTEAMVLPEVAPPGLRGTAENFAAAERASQANGAEPIPEATSETLPEADPKPARVRPSRAKTPAAEPTATLVENPDGKVAAAMEESPFGNEPAAEPRTPAEKRDEAISLLQQVFAHPSGPPQVRALQTRLKVKKFNEIPDDQADAFLAEARGLSERIQATAA